MFTEITHDTCFCPCPSRGPGLGVLGDGNPARGSESAGPGHTASGAALHGDPAQQRTPGPEECPHEGGAELHPGSHRPGTAAVCSQR